MAEDTPGDVARRQEPSVTCSRCGQPVDRSGWCRRCQRGVRIPAADWAGILLDDPVAIETAEPAGDDPLGWPGYADALAQLGREAVGVYRGRCGPHELVLVAFDFTVLGGSMGGAVGDRICRAFGLATAERLPLLTVTATGGSRMQEGIVSLAQMVRTTAAANAHASAGLLQAAVLSDPTTGGVYASFVSRADVLVAEPGAYVAFAGPRVAQALGVPAPGPAENRAESALANGLIDQVLPRPELRDWLATLLAATSHPAGAAAGSTPDGRAGPSVDDGPPRPGSAPPSRSAESPRAWQAVLAARAPDRPRAADVFARLTDVTWLSGDRAGGADSGLLAGVARLGGRPLVVVGQNHTRTKPAGYRTALRAFDLAARLRLPVLTLVDTPGADPSTAAEAAGQASAIAAALARLISLPSPTVAAVIGEGGSGGAMALCAADRLLLQRTAVFSVIAPEGAAAILHRDPSRAEEVADLLRLTADDVVALGVGDAVIDDGVEVLLAAVAGALDELAAEPASGRAASRARRWRVAW